MGEADGPNRGKAVVVVDGSAGAVRTPRYRHDGWTQRRQAEFCAALERGGSVVLACRAVGLTTNSAYKARARLPEFGRRWEEALEVVRPLLEDAAYRRAIDGWEEPVFHGGRQVGVRRRYSDNLLMMLLQRNFRGVEAKPLPSAPADDPRVRLAKQLDALVRRGQQAADGLGR